MTVKPESNFGRLLMKNINAHWTRIESFGTVGIPDLYGIRKGTVVWLELKCIKQNSIRLSPFQISWNYNNFKHGGKNYYIVQDTRSMVIKLYSGDNGQEIAKKGFLYDNNIAVFTHPYNWQDISNKLF
tara:strand:- start:47 stop:430 length:384 start_codon:yes stop_codon:yes gene_type:complete